ncbi:MAG TPA: hypothetical protein VFR67_22935 [Pilimelia sp.]|nr:hypothetical protein [Pilimelia sp.]
MATDQPVIAEPAPARPAAPDWRDVAVGALFEAQEAAVRVVAGLRGAAAAAVDPWQRSVRRAPAVADVARERVAELAARGAVERVRGRRRAADAMNALVDWVATAPVIDRVVDVQVDRILRPLVAAILDDVLGRLEAEPERIQALVRGQRDNMVDELVGRLRTGAAAGDTVIDRWTSWALRRRMPAAPPIAAGEPALPVTTSEPASPGATGVPASPAATEAPGAPAATSGPP